MSPCNRDSDIGKRRLLTSGPVVLNIPTFRKSITAVALNLLSSAFRWKDSQVFLAKCSEPLPIRWSKQIPPGCNPSTITVKLDAQGRWFVSLLVDDPTVKPQLKTDKAVGLELGSPV